MITLFAADTPNNQKVAIALMEMDLPFQIVPIDLSEGEQFGPTFSRISPNNKTPAIIDTEGPHRRPLTLFESGAILAYLADKSGLFLPTDPAARWTTIMWTFWQMANIGPTLGQAWHFAYRRNEEPYAVRRFISEGCRLWRVMDNRLAESEYLGGDEFTVADMATYPWAIASRRLLDARWSDYPNVCRWWNVVGTRPRLRKGMALIRHSTAKAIPSACSLSQQTG